MRKNLVSYIKTPEYMLSRFYLKFFREKNALIIIGFHGVFRDEDERKLNLVDPSTWVTLEDFRCLVEHYLHNGYTFVSPSDVLNGLDANKKYVMITFDDGYFNNRYLLPILRGYQIPAIFFISTNHVLNNKCFWWDVLYRERIKSGVSLRRIRREINQLKTRRNEDIESYLKGVFGADVFEPCGDIDRPFTSSELKSFSKEKHVFLGNHTSDHAILTNYSSNEVKTQIQVAQNTIYGVTGAVPVVISYPNGNYSAEIIRISREIGLKLGITLDARKNDIPVDCEGSECMHLGRFVYMAGMGVENQCKLFRSDIAPCTRIYSMVVKKS